MGVPDGICCKVIRSPDTTLVECVISFAVVLVSAMVAVIAVATAFFLMVYTQFLPLLGAVVI